MKPYQWRSDTLHTYRTVSVSLVGLVGLVDLLDGDDFYVGSDVISAAKV